MKYALIHSFIIAGLFGYIAASPFVLQSIYGLSAEAFSLCFAVNGLGILCFAQITARATTTLGDLKLLQIGLLLSLFASLLIFIAVHASVLNPLFYLIPLFIMVSCIGITTTTSFSLAIQSQKDCAGSASGLLGVISFIFGAGASPLVGLGGSQTALPMAILWLTVNLCPLYIFLTTRKK